MESSRGTGAATPAAPAAEATAGMAVIAPMPARGLNNDGVSALKR